MRTKLVNYLKAAYPLLYVVTWEEARIEADLTAVAKSLDYGLHSWSVTEGLVDLTRGAARDMRDPIDALAAIAEIPEKSLVCLKDFHAFLGDENQPANPLIVRTLRDLGRVLKGQQKCVLIAAPLLRLPRELEKEVTVIEHDLPSKADLGLVVDGIAKSAQLTCPEGDARDALLESALGLTTAEAENALALSFVERRALVPEVIAREKAQAVKKSGLLELWENTGSLDDVGGLDGLKVWLRQRRDAFTSRAKDFGLPVPKGLLMVGLPGCGKSLTAKAASAAWGRPLLRLDAGKIFGGLVGESERNLRRIIQVSEAIAPCCLWVDEIEKAFGGSGSSGTADGGTSARVFGSFLTWMEEKKSPVFVLATANDVSALPAELLRKGRFDELFFVDLPNEEERRGIFEIHLKKRGRDSKRFDVQALAKASELFSGAEIEAAVIGGMFQAFDAGQELETSHVGESVRATTPLAVTAREKVQALRDWAKTRARPAGKADAIVGRERKLA